MSQKPITSPVGERARALAAIGAGIGRLHLLREDAQASGVYSAQCWRPVPHRRDDFIHLRDQLADMLASGRTRAEDAVRDVIRHLKAIPLELAWDDRFENLVTTEGKNAALTHLFKGSTYTASNVIGLIEDAGYSAVAVGNTAANITANASASPANGWNEAQSTTAATRGTPSYGTASAGSLATSSSVSFSMLATDVIKGAFQLIRASGGTAPTTTVGNTNGALYSAGLFSGGDRSVSNGDTLNVSYTASL